MTQIDARFFGAPVEQPKQDGLIHGHAGPPGVVVGPAQIIRSVTEAGILAPSDILVAETTAPPWTPLFGTSAVVMTDTGGILSHCAVVAREYGFPPWWAPASRRPDAGDRRQSRHCTVAGHISGTHMEAAWLLTQSSEGNTQLLLPGMLVAAVLVLVLIVYEIRHPNPVFQPRLFRHRSFGRERHRHVQQHGIAGSSLLAALLAGSAADATNFAPILGLVIGGRIREKYSFANAYRQAQTMYQAGM